MKGKIGEIFDGIPADIGGLRVIERGELVCNIGDDKGRIGLP